MTTDTEIHRTPGEFEAWDDALAQWEAWAWASGSARLTISTYGYRLRGFAAAVGGDPWQVTLADCVRFLGNPAWAPQTRQSYRTAVRSFYTFALTLGHVDADPTSRLPGVRVPAGSPRPTPDRVMAAALESADDRTRLVLMLAAYGGLRRAEIAGLRWADMSDTHLRIRGKGGKVRVIPVHPDLAHELELERKRRDAAAFGTGYQRPAADSGEWVFPGRLRGHVVPAVIGRIATDALGSGWSTHTLRHRFATRAYGADRDLLAVQQLLGHADPATTQRYAELPNGALERAVAAAG